jgi:CBS domain-containing protein
MKRENIGSLLVIDNEQNRRLIGIITDRDLALKVVAEARDAKTTQVEAVMTRKVVSVRVEDDFHRALEAMSKYQLRRIPIVNNENKVVGIISQADVAIRLNTPEKTGEIVKDISQATIK